MTTDEKVGSNPEPTEAKTPGGHGQGQTWTNAEATETVEPTKAEQLSPEEQERIIKQIIAQSKASALHRIQKTGKPVSPNAKKKKKAKSKMQKASRKKNRK